MVNEGNANNNRSTRTVQSMLVSSGNQKALSLGKLPRRDSHATESQNTNNGHLRSLIHAQVPDQRRWKEANGEISDGCTDTVEIRDRDESVLIDAGSVTGG